MSTSEHFFKWQDAYSVNVQTLDEHHQTLVEMTNRLFVAVLERKASQIIVNLLETMRDHCHMHFAMEEQFLARISHKDLASHRHENRKLLEVLDSLREKQQREDKPIYFDMLCFIKHWMRDHFQSLGGSELPRLGMASANETFVAMSPAMASWTQKKAA